MNIAARRGHGRLQFHSIWSKNREISSTLRPRYHNAQQLSFISTNASDQYGRTDDTSNDASTPSPDGTGLRLVGSSKQRQEEIGASLASDKVSEQKLGWSSKRKLAETAEPKDLKPNNHLQQLTSILSHARMKRDGVLDESTAQDTSMIENANHEVLQTDVGEQDVGKPHFKDRTIRLISHQVGQSRYQNLKAILRRSQSPSGPQEAVGNDTESPPMSTISQQTTGKPRQPFKIRKHIMGPADSSRSGLRYPSDAMSHMTQAYQGSSEKDIRNRFLRSNRVTKEEVVGRALILAQELVSRGQIEGKTLSLGNAPGMKAGQSSKPTGFKITRTKVGDSNEVADSWQDFFESKKESEEELAIREFGLHLDSTTTSRQDPFLTPASRGENAISEDSTEDLKTQEAIDHAPVEEENDEDLSTAFDILGTIKADLQKSAAPESGSSIHGEQTNNLKSADSNRAPVSELQETGIDWDALPLSPLLHQRLISARTRFRTPKPLPQHSLAYDEKQATRLWDDPLTRMIMSPIRTCRLTNARLPAAFLFITQPVQNEETGKLWEFPYIPEPRKLRSDGDAALEARIRQEFAVESLIAPQRRIIDDRKAKSYKENIKILEQDANDLDNELRLRAHIATLSKDSKMDQVLQSVPRAVLEDGEPGSSGAGEAPLMNNNLKTLSNDLASTQTALPLPDTDHDLESNTDPATITAGPHTVESSRSDPFTSIDLTSQTELGAETTLGASSNVDTEALPSQLGTVRSYLLRTHGILEEMSSFNPKAYERLIPPNWRRKLDPKVASGIRWQADTPAITLSLMQDQIPGYMKPLRPWVRFGYVGVCMSMNDYYKREATLPLTSTSSVLLYLGPRKGAVNAEPSFAQAVDAFVESRRVKVEILNDLFGGHQALQTYAHAVRIRKENGSSMMFYDLTKMLAPKHLEAIRVLGFEELVYYFANRRESQELRRRLFMLAHYIGRGIETGQ